MDKPDQMYSIPERFRKIENLHIVFWLIKDLSWAMLWKPLGMIMIIPTIGAALLITWQTRKIKAELFHNLAVDFWICANAYWMIIEFYDMAEYFRYYTAIPFAIGILFIAAYYLVVLPAEKKKQKLVEVTLPVSEATLNAAKQVN